MNIELIAEQLTNISGFCSTLHLKCGSGDLVKSLNGKGLRAFGTGVPETLYADLEACYPGTFFRSIFPEDELSGKAVSVIVHELDFSHDPFDLVRKLISWAANFGRPLLFLYYYKTTVDGALEISWEEAVCRLNRILIQAGYRKHPLLQFIAPYGQLDDENKQVLVLEKVPESGLNACSLDELYQARNQLLNDEMCLPEGLEVRQRDLHMDMLREFGRRSDAHVARYSFACKFIRPNDKVIDVGCGLGYGTNILSCGSYAKQVVGFDISKFAISYSKSNYGNAPRIEFVEGDFITASEFMQANHADLIVAYEIVEHVKEPEALMEHCSKVLKPGGRMVLSVPNKWVDETGEDPWYFHEDWYDLAKILRLSQSHFIVEQVVAQRAGGKGNRFGDTRLFSDWAEASKENGEEAVEWWLLVLVKNPQEGEEVDYVESVFPVVKNPAGKYHPFEESYKNPWIMHSLVHGNLRISNSVELHRLIDEVSLNAANGSADLGAALCVKAYQIMTASWSDKEALIKEIDLFLNEADSTPHAFRWTVSLSFVKGLLALCSGLHEKAAKDFEQVSLMDAGRFSPHLMTKVAEAAFLAGKIYLAEGNAVLAEKHWRQGMAIGRMITGSSWDDIIINETMPNRFGLGDGIREYIVALDSVVRCVNGIYWINHGEGRKFLQLGIEDSFWKIEKRSDITRGLLTLEGEAKSRNYYWALAAEERKRRLEDITEELNTKLKERSEYLGQLVHENDELNRRIFEYNEQLSRTKEEKGRVVEDLYLATSHLRDVSAELEEVKSDFTSVSAELEEVKSDFTSVSAELDEVKLKYSDVSSQRDEMEKAIVVLDEENSKLRTKIKEFEVLLEEQGVRLESLNWEINKSRELISLRSEENEGLKQLLDDQSRECLQLQSDVRQKVAQIEKLALEIKELRVECDSLNGRIRELNMQNANLERERATYMSEAGSLREQLFVEQGRVRDSLQSLSEFRVSTERQKRVNEGELEAQRLRFRHNTLLGLRLRLGNSLFRFFRQTYELFSFKKKKGRDELSVTQINTHDLIGGAERSSYDLHCEYRKIDGVKPILYVAGKFGQDDDVIKIQYNKKDWKWAEIWRDKWGFTEAFYPTPIMGCFRWSELRASDVVHIHNMHGMYWSSSSLLLLANQSPVVMTLHDEYTMTGDCCYAYDCEGWKKSCGNCPQVSFTERKDRYTLAAVDRTSFNVRLKRFIFRAPKAFPLVIVTPTRWLSSRARRSPNLRHLPVITIPNGVNLDFWKEEEQGASRASLHLPGEGLLALVVANDLSDRRKGFDIVLDAIRANGKDGSITFVVLGGVNPEIHEACEGYPVHLRGHIKDKSEIRKYFSAVDFTIAMSKSDNLPYMCLESLACGRPVMASDAGGIPEIISDPALGWLLPQPISTEDMLRYFHRIEYDLTSGGKETRFKMCRHAAEVKYDLKTMVLRYKTLYENLINKTDPVWKGIE